MLYTGLRSVNRVYIYLAFGLYFAMFVVAFVLMFILPFAAIWMLFIGLISLVIVIAARLGLLAAEHAVARTILRHKLCPRCNHAIALTERGESQWDCSNCGAAYAADGREQSVEHEPADRTAAELVYTAGEGWTEASEQKKSTPA